MREGRMLAPQLGSLYVNRSIKAPKGSASGGATSDSTNKGQVTPQLKGTFRSATVAAELPRSIAEKRRRVSFADPVDVISSYTASATEPKWNCWAIRSGDTINVAVMPGSSSCSVTSAPFPNLMPSR